MPAVGETVTLIDSESELVFGPVRSSRTKHCPRLTSPVGLGAVPGFDPTSTFPTPSMAVYGLLRSKQVAFGLPRVTKEYPEVHFSSP